MLQVRAWLKGLPSSKRPLVSMTAQQASDLAVDRLQLALPGLLPAGTRTVGEDSRSTQMPGMQGSGWPSHYAFRPCIVT